MLCVFGAIIPQKGQKLKFTVTKSEKKDKIAGKRPLIFSKPGSAGSRKITEPPSTPFLLPLRPWGPPTLNIIQPNSKPQPNIILPTRTTIMNTQNIVNRPILSHKIRRSVTPQKTGARSFPRIPFRKIFFFSRPESVKFLSTTVVGELSVKSVYILAFDDLRVFGEVVPFCRIEIPFIRRVAIGDRNP